MRTRNYTQLGRKSKRTASKLEIANTLAYQSWRAMNRRCYDKNYHSYKYYGEKGIKVCPSWKVFSNFLQDMGEPINFTGKQRLTLNRKNNLKYYSKENCEWTSSIIQNN